MAYKVYCTSVLSYIMLYAEVPKHILRIESGMIAKTLKMPCNSIPNIVTYHLDIFNLPPMPDISALGRASMARAWMSLQTSTAAEATIADAEDSMDFIVDPVLG